MKEKFLPFARKRGGSVVTLICAVAILFSFAQLQPWSAVSFNRAGFTGTFPQQGATGGNTGTTQGNAPAVNATPAASTGGSGNTQGFAPPVGAQNGGAATGGNGQTFQPPADFTPPANFDPSQLPAGFDPSQVQQQPGTGTTDTGGQAATGQTGQTGQQGGFAGGAGRIPGGGRFGGGLAGSLISVLSNPLILVVPLAALVGLIVTLVALFKLRFNRWARLITTIAGALALLYFVQHFVSNSGQAVTAGFWVAMVGCIGMVAQIGIPRALPEGVERKKVADFEGLPQKKSVGLDIGQNLGIAVDALMANKLRSILTMLGVVIGVMSVVALLSVGQGAQASVTERIQGTGLNILTISSGRGGFGGGNSQTLTYADAQALEKSLTGIDGVLSQYSGNMTVRSDAATITVSVRGVTSKYAELTNMDMELGNFISNLDDSGRNRVAVLGSDASEELFGGVNPVGRSIRINGKRFEVIGVLDEQDSTGGQNANLDIYVPLNTGYRNLFDAKAKGSSDNLVSNIRVVVTNVDDVETVKTQVEAILRDRHKLKADADNDFNVFDQQSLLETAQQITGVLTVLLGAIASVSLIVGGIGIMNISLVSVTERTKEIGLRKAIGARKSNILRQFLIETIMLSTLGGIIGVLLGVLIALLVNSSGLLNAKVTPDSVALGLGFSIVVGVFFGVYPATRAAALQPIEALRYE